MVDTHGVVTRPIEVYRPQPQVAGVKPTFTYQYIFAYDATSVTIDCNTPEFWTKVVSMPDFEWKISPTTQSLNAESQDTGGLIRFAYCKATKLAAAFTDVDDFRAKITIADWSSLRTIYFAPHKYFTYVLKATVGSTVIVEVPIFPDSPGLGLSYSGLRAFGNVSDNLILEVVFYDADGTYVDYMMVPKVTSDICYLPTDEPVYATLDFFNKTEEWGTELFVAGLASLGTFGLTEMVSKSIENTVGKVFASLGSEVVTTLSVSLGYAWSQGWIQSFDDLKRIMKRIPQNMAAIGGAWAAGIGFQALVSKYNDQFGKVLGGQLGDLAVAGGAGIATAAMLSIVDDISFEMYIAGVAQ